jgi:EAL domain-containing protein (putative c-di-GMP-specific phosphodiesterase class I)
MQSDQELNYLTKSLLHHPSPYIIYELDGSIAWANIAAKYIFNLTDLDALKVAKIDEKVTSNFGDQDSIALYYDTPIEISLRKITFYMRTRVHMIPVDESKGIMLIEILCSSRAGLDALRKTIDCIEYDRIELAYQKQVNLETNEVTGVEALLRLRDEDGSYLRNDLIIPQIEGESLFSLVVLESLKQLEKFFAVKESIGLKDATLYLNVSAHTIMHPEFCSIFTDFVTKHSLEPNQFGLEVTETAELADIQIASDSLNALKKQGIKIALDDFGAGYASLRYIQDLPIDVVKLDKHFTFNIKDPVTSRLIGFVTEVCKDLNLEMIGEGVETEEERQAMLDLGCKIGQGYLMHRPAFLESFTSSTEEHDG